MSELSTDSLTLSLIYDGPYHILVHLKGLELWLKISMNMFKTDTLCL